MTIVAEYIGYGLTSGKRVAVLGKEAVVFLCFDDLLGRSLRRK